MSPPPMDSTRMVPIFSPADILLHYFTLEPSLLSSEHLLQAALDYSDSKPGKPKAKRSAKPKAEKEKGSLEASVEILAEQEPQEVQKPQHDSSRWVLPPQITHLGATVSPDNSYSLRNAQAGGFVIRCRREMYGGYDRYLLEKQL